MKQLLIRCLLLFLLIGYSALFVLSERNHAVSYPRLSGTLPAPVQQVALGYLSQLGAEMLFVKVAVFTGVPLKLPPAETYAPALAQNFDVMTELYPEFRDPYYMAQSTLPYLSSEYAGRANLILERGAEAHPDDLLFPFFHGFNLFYFMNENARAAEIFSLLAKRPEAPSWLGHLAAVLSAKDGDLYGGLLTLRVMHAAEEDPNVKERYANDIRLFEEAINVLEATQAYEEKYKHPPETLEALVPEFLSAIPDTGPFVKLVWTPPILRLVRPEPSAKLPRSTEGETDTPVQ
jgi:hypothetical protein